MYPGLVVTFFATREWTPGNKRPPRWRQVAAFSCKYSWADVVSLSKGVQISEECTGLRIRKKLIT